MYTMMTAMILMEISYARFLKLSLILIQILATAKLKLLSAHKRSMCMMTAATRQMKKQANRF